MIIIKVDTKRVTNMLTKYTRTIPKAGEEGIRKTADYGVRALKEEARKAGIKFWGGRATELYRDTRAKKQSKNRYVITMPKHGMYLDRMRTHYVAFKRGRLITKWAKERGIKTKRGITVRKHPFITSAVTRTIRNAKEITEQEINKAIRGKGK